MATLEKVAADNCDKMEAGIRYLFMFDGLVKSTSQENVGIIWGSKIIRHP